MHKKQNLAKIWRGGAVAPPPPYLHPGFYRPAAAEVYLELFQTYMLELFCENS